MHTFLSVVLFAFCYNELSFAFGIDKLGQARESKVDTKVPDYRYDYTYIEDIDGWVKLHRVPATWNQARTRCKREGGELATPLDVIMLETMTNIMKNHLFPGIFTGIHSKYSYGDYYTMKGIALDKLPVTWTNWGPLPDNDKRCVVLLRNSTITNDNCDSALRPYVCYKRNNNETLTECGTVDREYTYNRDLDTCYKIHKRTTTWHDAFLTCSAEGGHLLVINSEKEFRSVFTLLKTYPKEIHENVFVGLIDNDKTGQWTTIHDDALEESGFSTWLPGEPNNPTYEFCGSVIRGEGYNNAPCEAKLPFVCEKKTDSLMNKQDSFDITQFYRSAL